MDSATCSATTQMVGSGSGGLRFGAWGPLRVIIIVLQLLTGCAFVITLGGLSKLQHEVNHLGLQALAEVAPAQAAAANFAYIETFQSGNQIPYPAHGPWQFGVQWWGLVLYGTVCFSIFIAAILPGLLPRVKPVAMAFLPYTLLLGTINANSVLYFHRNKVARQTFGATTLTVLLIGTLMGDVLVGATIIFLGLINPDSDYFDNTDAATTQGGGTKVTNGRRDLDAEAN